MKKSNITIFSKTDNLRLYIIEHTLHIETLISEAIGALLGIEYNNSKSFGFGSSSLSFNQKVQIIQDIEGLESEMTKKLTCLMNIRNKFAHVQEIESFDNLFDLTSNGSEIKKQLVKWYTLDEKEDNDEEYKYRFFKLAEEITQMLFMLQVTTKTKNGVQEVEKQFQAGNLQSYMEVISEMENSEEIKERVMQRTAEKLSQLDIYKKS
jgi:hypothetical protein